MKATQALAAGAAGAITVTIAHETLRHFDPKAPHMEKMGEVALKKILKKAGVKPPKGTALYASAMAGDIVANSLYYATAGVGEAKNPVLKGAVLGLLAGAGALFLPGPLGLPERYSKRSLRTATETVGLYLLGGLVAGLAVKMLREKNDAEDKENVWKEEGEFPSYAAMG